MFGTWWVINKFGARGLLTCLGQGGINKFGAGGLLTCSGQEVDLIKNYCCNKNSGESRIFTVKNNDGRYIPNTVLQIECLMMKLFMELKKQAIIIITLKLIVMLLQI